MATALLDLLFQRQATLLIWPQTHPRLVSCTVIFYSNIVSRENDGGYGAIPLTRNVALWRINNCVWGGGELVVLSGGGGYN